MSVKLKTPLTRANKGMVLDDDGCPIGPWLSRTPLAVDEILRRANIHDELVAMLQCVADCRFTHDEVRALLKKARGEE